MPRKLKAVPKPIGILLPEPIYKPTWLIIGLDLSLSRTGYALFKYDGSPSTQYDGAASVLKIGSIKPKDSSTQVWARALGMMQFVRDLLTEDAPATMLDKNCGVIISCEMFTPRNDFLSTINRIMNATLMGPQSLLHEREVHNLYINAATLRRYMGLKQRGSGNKAENMVKAYTYVPKTLYPKLNTDSCDAVLMAQVGVYAAAIISGNVEQVPYPFKEMLCDSTQRAKGTGIRARLETKGLFHNPVYWFTQKTSMYEFSHQDATNTKRSEIIEYKI